MSDAGTLDTLRELLTPDNTIDVRVAALDGLAALGVDRTNGIVAAELTDGDRRVRLAAAKAMGKVARPEDADQLGNMLNPQVEHDPDVRDAAWAALRRLLDGGSVDLLNSFIARFGADPDRQLVVRQDLDRALVRAGRLEEAASNDQQVGQLLMDLQRPGDAIAPLQAALQYQQRTADPGATLTALVGQLLDAQLGAGQYQAAVDFAAEQIKANPSYKGTAGVKFLNRADFLEGHDRRADALALVNAALAMQPSLDERYVNQLQDIRAELQATPARGRRP